MLEKVLVENKNKLLIFKRLQVNLLGYRFTNSGQDLVT